MISLVYLTDAAPDPLATELTLAGCLVWEALSVSEVLHLCEHQRIDVVVVAPAIKIATADVEARNITIHLKPGATVADVMWELSHLFTIGNPVTQ